MNTTSYTTIGSSTTTTAGNGGNTSTARNEVTSTLAYLIAVPDRIFGPLYDRTLFEELENECSAKTVRCLSTVRNILLMQNGTIGNHIRRNLYGNIDEFVEPSILDYLEGRGIQLVTPCPWVNDIIRRLNQLIAERVEECKDLFSGIEWRFVRRLFTMREDIPAVVDDMHMRKKSFPFQCYMNWPIRDPRAYQQGMGASQGNVLVDDQTFLRLLYLINDAAEPKSSLKSFLSEASDAVLAVDCENSDPYKLCAAMWELKEESPQSFSKIRKTVLFDDIHTNPVWRSLDRFLPVPVEHILTQRVNDHKSLVDIQMTAGVAKEHYVGGVDSFLLASSDSDYWGLIKSLPTAKFMVLMEREKVSDSLTEALDSNGIGYYCIDNVDTEKVRNAALDEGVRSELPEVNLEAVLEKMRIQMGEEERKVYLQGLCGRLTLEVTEGVLRIKVA